MAAVLAFLSRVPTALAFLGVGALFILIARLPTKGLDRTEVRGPGFTILMQYARVVESFKEQSSAEVVQRVEEELVASQAPANPHAARSFNSYYAKERDAFSLILHATDGGLIYGATCQVIGPNGIAWTSRQGLDSLIPRGEVRYTWPDDFPDAGKEYSGTYEWVWSALDENGGPRVASRGGFSVN